MGFNSGFKGLSKIFGPVNIDSVWRIRNNMEIDNLTEGADTRVVRKVSSHFEYLQNRSSVFDITWQPVRGDLTVHLRTATLPWD